jgi:hypothetical protein
MVLLALLVLLALTLLATPRPATGGVFGQPGHNASVTTPHSVYTPAR